MFGFVNRHIEERCGIGDGPPVEGDAVLLWVRSLPQLGDPAIDADPSCRDQFLTVAPRTDICLSEDFLQALGGRSFSHQLKY